MKVNVRRPTIEDYPDAERLMQQVHALHVAWRPDIFKSVETVLTRAMFEHDLANDTAFIAEVEGQAVGLMRINRFETGNFLTMNRKVLFIDAMVVDEAFRKQGIGTALLDFLKEMKKSRASMPSSCR